MNGTRSRLTVHERFWSKVDRSGGPDACWPYTDGKNGGGYGVFWLDRRIPVLAHRFAAGIEDPEQEGCHSCDNPPCCNPAHVFPGTHADNMADASNKGRSKAGVAHKSQCVHGHALEGDNLAIKYRANPKNGKTYVCYVCVTCRRAEVRRRKTRNRTTTSTRKVA